MNLKRKVVAVATALLMVFGLGVGTGYHLASPSPLYSVFTPDQKGLPAYLEMLDRAQKNVHIAAYAFTEPHITDKLIELKERSVKVHVLLDESQSNGKYQKAQIERLRAAGIDVLIGDSPKRGEIMHNKFTVVDEEWIEDGSWNYSKSADYQSNVLNFDRNRARAAKFLATWKRIEAHMQAH